MSTAYPSRLCSASRLMPSVPLLQAQDLLLTWFSYQCFSAIMLLCRPYINPPTIPLP